MVVGVTICFAGAGMAFAATGDVAKTAKGQTSSGVRIQSISAGMYTFTLTKAGTIYVYGEANSSVTVTSPSGATSYISLGSDGIGARHYNVAGVYYVQGSIDANKSAVLPDAASGQTLKAGKTYTFGNDGSSADTFKFKATKTGFLKISKDSGLSAKFTLWKGSKKVANADYAYTSIGSFYYGVTKGKTYKIKMDPSYMDDCSYAIKLTNKAVKETSGKTKSKAKKIKKKKLYKGTIQAGSGQADWYKYNPKKKNSKVIIKGYTAKQLKVQCICKGSGNTTYTRTIYGPSQSLTLSMYNSKKSCTWYIKISRSDKYSSGYYTLKWK